MKKYIYTFLLAAFLGTSIVTEANAQQSKSTNNEPVYVFADKMPAFPGGEEALKAYFEKALSGLNSDSRGLVALSLVINKNGKAEEVTVSQGMKPEIDAAVVKAALNMPAWQPGVKDNKSVNVRVNIPVVIQMSQQAIATQDAEASKRTYEYVEQMPEFPGGQTALMNFIKDKTQYPEEAVKNKLEGMVFVKFTVTYEGNITDTEILKTPATSLSNEALRVIGLMPKWKPGKQNGRAVNTKYTIPFRFTLPDRLNAFK